MAFSDFDISDTFPHNTRDAWLDLVAGGRQDTDALQKAIAKLTTSTLDGIDIEPVYSRQDQNYIDYHAESSRRHARRYSSTSADASGTASVTASVTKHGHATPWDIRQAVRNNKPSTANEAILDELQRGATSIQLVTCAGESQNKGSIGISLRSAEDVATLLEGVYLDLVTLALEPANLPGDFARWLLEYYDGKDLATEQTRIAFNISPCLQVSSTDRKSGDYKLATTAFADFAVATLARFPSVKTAAVDTRYWHNQGANNVQELAIACADCVHLVKAMLSAGLTLEQAANQIVFHMAVDTDFFAGIAKLRALRELIQHILAQFTANASNSTPLPVQIQAHSSQRMLTRLDADNNQLRNTLACAAAAIGGADIISVEPHVGSTGSDYPLVEPPELSRRIARNLQLVLLEESNLHRVSDPLGGSAFVESLTTEMVAKGWQAFLDLESEGGLATSIQSSALIDRIQSTQQQRMQRVASGKSPTVGVSEFATLDEPAFDAPDQSDSNPSLLRSSEPFEILRSSSWQYENDRGHKPAVLLLTIGSPEDYRARAGFSRNFLASAGVSTAEFAIESSSLENPTDVVQKLEQRLGDTKTTVAVICASNAIYENLSTEFTNALRSAGVTYLVVAGRKDGLNPDADIISSCDSDIYLRCNAIEKLSAIQLAVTQSAVTQPATTKSGAL